MKYRLAILFAAFCLVRSAFCQLVVTNSIIGDIDVSSYGTTPYYFIPGDLTAGLNLVYPKWRHMVSNSSGSGKTMEQQLTNSVPLFDPAVWCLATSNGVVPWNLVLVNDNGNYTSNSLHPFGVRYYGVPSVLWNGTANTNEQFSSLTVQTVFLGGIVSSGGSGDLNGIDRNAAAMELNTEIGISPDDLWHDTWNNGLSGAMFSVLDGSEFFYAFNHPTQKHAFMIYHAVWREQGLKTALCSITFDVGRGSVSASNGVAAVNTSWDGRKLTSTIKQDCQAFHGDVLASVSNNLATTIWTNAVFAAAFGNMFTETYQFTNLNSTHIYVLAFDGNPVFTNSGAGWATGVNLATNNCLANPFVTKSTQVLYDVCQEYGMNPTNGLLTHSAGNNGPLGPDLINYQSLGPSKWPGLHGPSLVNDATVQTDVLSMWNNYAAATHTDAQQASHTLTLTDISTRFAPFSVEIDPPDLIWVWDAPTNYQPDTYEVQSATDIAQFKEPRMGCFVFRGEEIWTTNNFLPVYLDAPQCFYRVRAWKDASFSDWAIVAPGAVFSLNSQLSTQN